MGKVVWTEPALEDLKDLIDYIARDSRIYAQRFGIRLVEAPERLEDFPHVGRVVPEFSDESIREIFCGSYRIIYQVRGEICYIVSIIHGSRDILRHLDPGDWDIA